MSNKYQHFKSFILIDPKTNLGKSLYKDFGAIIIDTNDSYYERECLPDFKDVVDESETKHGSVFIDSYYKPRIINMTIFFPPEADDNLQLFKRWVGKTYEQKFEWEDDEECKYIYTKLNKGFTSKAYYGKDFNGMIDLEFIAYNPFYKIKSERDLVFDNVVLNREYNIRTNGNTDSSPIIKIIPKTNNINLTWNNISIKLKGLTVNREYILDCEMELLYYINGDKKVNCMSMFESNSTWDFPLLNMETKNTFKLTSGSCSIKVNPNSNII